MKPCLPGKTHHWIIKPATGGPSEGQCQNCLEVRDFANSFEQANWDVSRVHHGRDNRQDGLAEHWQRESWLF